MKKLLASTLILFSMSSCAHPDGTPMSANEIFTKQNVGAVVGAVGGAWLGSNIGKGSGQIAAIAAGTLLGGFVGKSIGTSLDKADQIEHANAYDKALESSEDSKPVLWSNPKTGNSGKVTPTKTYKVANGSTCKEYKESITVGGEIYEEVGKACRQPDGTWKVM